eukprot:3089445-Pyramimonas_sp.AAC.1
MAATKWFDNRARHVVGSVQASEQEGRCGEWCSLPMFVLDGVGQRRLALGEAAALASEACSPVG